VGTNDSDLRGFVEHWNGKRWSIVARLLNAYGVEAGSGPEHRLAGKPGTRGLSEAAVSARALPRPSITSSVSDRARGRTTLPRVTTEANRKPRKYFVSAARVCEVDARAPALSIRVRPAPISMSREGDVSCGPPRSPQRCEVRQPTRLKTKSNSVPAGLW
jgi:hypothetical protein